MNYYQILGVTQFAEDVVIKAAYRALVSMYHPDKNPSNADDDKIKKINEAYNTLKDPPRRAEYDKKLSEQGELLTGAEFETKMPYTIAELDDKWKIAVSFYPDLEKNLKGLGRISWRLAFSFKIFMIETKKFNDGSAVCCEMKKAFLQKYFGSQSDALVLAEQLIDAKCVKELIWLHKIVKTMGASVEQWKVKDKLFEHFPSVKDFLRKRRLFRNLLGEELGPGIFQYDYFWADELVQLMNGSLKKKFLGSFILSIEGENYEFSSKRGVCEFLHKKYESLLA